MTEFKKNLSNLILAGAVLALVFFAVSLFLPKYYLITGKVVIIPSGSSPTAGQNLYLEAGNAAEIMDGPSFKKNVLGDDAANYAGAKRIDASSVVAASYLAGNTDIQKTEDILVTFPDKLAGYSRDLYGGQPFKYLLVSDPEVSPSPVKPDLIKNSLWGFAAGALLYLLYWIFSGRVSSAREEIETLRKEFPVVSPAIPTAPEEKIEPEKAEPAVPEAPENGVAGVPDNLPVAGEKTPPPVSENHEPTDDEVKDRLNRLMRGEL